MISFKALIEARPLIHRGREITWGISLDLATFIDEYVQPWHVTLETGSGLSTLVIARKGGRRHIAIAPDADEFQVIREFLVRHQIEAGSLETIVSRSQDYLPTAILPELDLVLIDGDHSFPAPFLDWYYTADRLKVGGLMAVDDADIVTGTFLVDFMRADPKWEEVVRSRSGRYGIYRKIRHPVHEDAWERQPYVGNVYPTKALKAVKRRPPDFVTRTMAKILPWRLVQIPLRKRFDWPKSE